MRFILIVIIIFFSFTVKAQKASQDSSAVQQRSFAAPSINSYKNDKDFQYENETIEQPSLWDRFWNWFWHWFDDLMSTEAGRVTLKIVYWALAIGAVGFFIFKARRMNRMALFEASAANNTGYSVEEENIHGISFETAIQQALQDGNYKLALRFMYLQSLKILADKNLIAWLPNKTNTDYLRELSTTNFQQPFRAVTNIFEHAWYGNLAVKATDFELMRDEFLKFQNQLSAR